MARSIRQPDGLGLKQYLRVETAPVSQTVAVTASALNVRSGPGTHYSIIPRAIRDTRLTVQKEQSGWLLVRLFNGLTGWVYGKYVRLSVQ